MVETLMTYDLGLADSNNCDMFVIKLPVISVCLH